MIDPKRLDWGKMDGLIPAVVQDASSGEVRMLGYMDKEALATTIAEGFVTFRSRSQGELWRKGATSGNFLVPVDIKTDCDRDALLVLARPEGPTCHQGSSSCFGEEVGPSIGFLARLEAIVNQQARASADQSYTARLMAEGVKRIAQKVGEEATETALAAVAGNRQELTSETADLIYHLTVLLHASNLHWSDVVSELRRRHQARTTTASS
jgi:phosphoribosyl-ATP pyrophosphohydrolase/phosphoribosyl-AMP cyclohydrolase